MKDYQLTKGNLNEFFNLISNELDSESVLIASTQSAKVGKWGMTKLWRAWMQSTAEFMADNGCTMPLVIDSDGTAFGTRKYNSEDAHLYFTHLHLGVDKDGVRLSWSRQGRDGMRAATKGERFNALQRHEAWASERGIKLFKPRGSEYEKLELEQDR